jgi:membrane associated rhomboid family serine protease
MVHDIAAVPRVCQCGGITVETGFMVSIPNPARSCGRHSGSAMRNFLDDVKLMAGLLGLLWLVLVIDLLVFRGGLFAYGIMPRTLRGLIGIPLAPLLHLGPFHLLANSGPFFVLGLMMLRHGRRVFWLANLAIILVGGLATWCIAPAHSIHAGASALIFGWFGFVVTAAWAAPRLTTVAAALLAIAWYGLGFLFGLSPLHYGVSWQGHLTGLLAGGLAAYALSRPTLKLAKRQRS